MMRIKILLLYLLYFVYSYIIVAGVEAYLIHIFNIKSGTILVYSALLFFTFIMTIAFVKNIKGRLSHLILLITTILFFFVGMYYASKIGITSREIAL